MRTFTISDELYEQLKRFIVDPFDDTPEVVIERLVEIVDKARSRWSPFGRKKRQRTPASGRKMSTVRMFGITICGIPVICSRSRMRPRPPHLKNR